MRDADGFTPKEKATDLVLGWIRMIEAGKTADLGDIEASSSPVFYTKVRSQLRKIHNRMLDNSGLDGLPIDEPQPEVTTMRGGR